MLLSEDEVGWRHLQIYLIDLWGLKWRTDGEEYSSIRGERLETDQINGPKVAKQANQTKDSCTLCSESSLVRRFTIKCSCVLHCVVSQTLFVYRPGK